MGYVFVCKALFSCHIMSSALIAHNNSIEHFPNKALSVVVNKL